MATDHDPNEPLVTLQDLKEAIAAALLINEGVVARPQQGEGTPLSSWVKRQVAAAVFADAIERGWALAPEERGMQFRRAIGDFDA